MSKKAYEYQGCEYSITRLSKMAHLHRDTIVRRLERGVTLDDILNTAGVDEIIHFNSENIGKQIPIVFTEQLPVFESMQPVLGKQYMATIYGHPANGPYASKFFFLIELGNGKKLITYPGEFELVETSLKKIQ